jgi:hypothetical protein
MIANEWNRIGEIEISHKGEMDAIENMLDIFDGHSGYNFSSTKFKSFVLLKVGVQTRKNSMISYILPPDMLEVRKGLKMKSYRRLKVTTKGLLCILLSEGEQRENLFSLMSI